MQFIEDFLFEIKQYQTKTFLKLNFNLDKTK